MTDVLKIKRQSWKKKTNGQSYNQGFPLFRSPSPFLSRSANTRPRFVETRRAVTLARAMSLLLVSWVKVDVSHAGLASICHQPEKSAAISRRYAGDPRCTVIHGKCNYKSHPASRNVPFCVCVLVTRLKMYQRVWHIEWRIRVVSKANRIRVSRIIS